MGVIDNEENARCEMNNFGTSKLDIPYLALAVLSHAEECGPQLFIFQ
jgi:hypothetical protein